ncbi:AAA family ATPase [Enterococcus cecorum]|uniref:AAA family ATPase n=1 Tax=Enterococcus cecorum TaxID=44008 RepID=UPI0032C3E13D
MAVLIILRGNSGSGKTSVAKKLQEKLGAETILISQDVVRREMLHTKDGPHSQAIPFIMHLLQYASQHENYVILEGILNATWYRPVFQFVKELFGDAIFAYYYDLPF